MDYQIYSFTCSLLLLFCYFVSFSQQQVCRSEGESGAIEQSQHHLLTLTHLVPWHYATILLSGICTLIVQCNLDYPDPFGHDAHMGILDK